MLELYVVNPGQYDPKSFIASLYNAIIEEFAPNSDGMSAFGSGGALDGWTIEAVPDHKGMVPLWWSESDGPVVAVWHGDDDDEPEDLVERVRQAVESMRIQ